MTLTSKPRLIHLMLAGLLASTMGHTANATDMYVQSTGVGIGTSAPERQLHLVGTNAVFRMDRPVDTAAFIIVRTTAQGVPMKGFAVGTNASGSNVGEFVINDLGASASGAGTRRMTIANNGNVNFSGNLVAATVNSSSSVHLKQDIAEIENPIVAVQSIRGVRFNWRDTGQPSLGVIAQEVHAVLPEVVSLDEATGEPVAVNYSALVGVLIEAVKAQQITIATQGAAIEDLKLQVKHISTIQAR